MDIQEPIPKKIHKCNVSGDDIKTVAYLTVTVMGHKDIYRKHYGDGSKGYWYTSWENDQIILAVGQKDIRDRIIVYIMGTEESDMFIKVHMGREENRRALPKILDGAEIHRQG